MGQQSRILLIEDEKALGAEVRGTCSEHDIIRVHTKLEAVEFIKKESPALILLAAKAGSSAATVNLIKHLEYSVPLIVISGGEEKNTVARMRDQGIYRYFDSPVDPVELQAAVRSAIAMNNDSEHEEHGERCGCSDPACRENVFPLDLESFIQKVIADEVKSMPPLDKAVQSFREKYVDFIVEKYKNGSGGAV